MEFNECNDGERGNCMIHHDLCEPYGLPRV